MLTLHINITVVHYYQNVKHHKTMGRLNWNDRPRNGQTKTDKSL